ncbi:MAG: hypothetical protein LBK57_10315 [Clostridiales Family XIII bacterium]|jgi:hypothetical protein|nr:hypothetical protein [Clostridiales Family XIII bacterium]
MLNEVYESVQKEMAAKLLASRNSIPHSAEMGSASEDDWANWFNEYLPKRYQAKRAFIVDSSDSISNQIDIVVHDAQYSHLIFKHNNTVYVPAESVYAIFEVKQELTKVNLEYAGAKAESVRRLSRTSAPIPHAGGTYPPKEPHFIPAGILTVTSEWKEPLGETFQKNLSSLQGDQSIQLGCVIQSGAFTVKDTGIEISNTETSLVSFFFDMLIRLQSLGTVTAIDIQAYANALNNKEGISNGQT